MSTDCHLTIEFNNAHEGQPCVILHYTTLQLTYILQWIMGYIFFYSKKASKDSSTNNFWILYVCFDNCAAIHSFGHSFIHSFHIISENLEQFQTAAATAASTVQSLIQVSRHYSSLSLIPFTPSSTVAHTRTPVEHSCRAYSLSI